MSYDRYDFDYDSMANDADDLYEEDWNDDEDIVDEQKEWENIVRMITSGITEGKLIGGIESAIHRCGEILLEKGFDKSADDTNELSDNLRVD